MRYLNLVFIIFIVGSCQAFIAPGFPLGDVIEIPDVDYFRRGDAIIGTTPGMAGVSYYYPLTAIYIGGQSPDGLDRECRVFIDNNSDIFDIESRNLRLLRAENRLDRWWITYTQFHADIPVEGGRVDFRVFGSGRLAFCGAKVISTFDGESPAIPQSQAIDIAKENYLKYGTFDNTDIVYWPDYDEVLTIGRLAWRIDLSGNSGERWRCYISAIDGKPLYHYSLVNYYDVWGTGYIDYLPRYWDDTFEVAEFQYGDMNLNYFHTGRTDAVGQYMLSSILSWDMPLKAYLSGEWASVEDREGDDGVYQTWLIPPEEHSFEFTTAWADSDEINLYYHTTYIHEYYEELDPPMSALDYPVPARAGIPGTAENAFWDGYGTNYGSGGMSTRNFALFSNIIYHEYTHGITGWIYEGTHFPYSGQPGAMNEAYSDYFACTNNDDPRVGYKCQITGSQMFRTMDNNYHYPENWAGEVHADGRIMGGAFWDLRERIEKGSADSLIHFTRYATPNTFHGFVPECIFTDDNDDDLSNGTPHFFEILVSFHLHGIGPGIFPNFVSGYEMNDIGDGDGYLENGEQMEIVPYIAADDSFSWPSIEGLRATLRFTHDEIAMIIDSTSTFDADIEPGDTDIGDPFLIEAPIDNLPHMAEISITYYADNSPLIIADTFEIYVGHPQLLLVDDDPDSFSQVNEYYRSVIEELGVTYLYHKTLTRGRPMEFDDFPAMLWFTGNDTDGVAIDEEDTASISEFLSAGGHVILTGQQMTHQFPPSFLSNHFGAIHYLTGATVLLSGRDTPWLSFGDDQLILIGAPGACNQRPGRITSLTEIDGETIFEYSSGSSAAVASFNGMNKTVLFGFGIEGIGGTAYMHLPELLTEIFEWFGLQFTSVDEIPTKLPNKLDIAVYPNPFNASCRIEMSGIVDKIEIFDVNGLLVESLDPNNGGFVLWHPEGKFPSGVYYIRVTGDNERRTVKAVLLR